MKHHGAGLLRHVGDADWVERFTRDFRSVALEADERAMLEYVAALTESPPRATRESIEELRELGFSDEAILEINQVAGFFCWINRTIEGLGAIFLHKHLFWL